MRCIGSYEDCLLSWRGFRCAAAAACLVFSVRVSPLSPLFSIRYICQFTFSLLVTLPRSLVPHVRSGFYWILNLHIQPKHLLLRKDHYLLFDVTVDQIQCILIQTDRPGPLQSCQVYSSSIFQKIWHLTLWLGCFCITREAQNEAKICKSWLVLTTCRHRANTPALFCGLTSGILVCV